MFLKCVQGVDISFASLSFGDLLHAQIRALNLKYKEAEGALVGEFQRFHSDITATEIFDGAAQPAQILLRRREPRAGHYADRLR